MPQVSHEFKIVQRRHIGIERNGFWKIAYPFAHFQGFFDNVISGDGGSAFGGRHIPRQDSHGCGFACSIGTEKAYDFPLLSIEGEVVNGTARAIVLGETIDLDHWCSLK